MAKRHVSVSSVSVSRTKSEISQAIAKRVRLMLADTNPNSHSQKLYRELASRRQLAVAKESAKYYGGMLEKTGQILRAPPVPAVTRGDTGRATLAKVIGKNSAPLRQYQKTLRFSIPVQVPGTAEVVSLQPGRDKQDAWDPLGEFYAESKGVWTGMPRSLLFWRKTGRLAARYSGWWAKAQARVLEPKNYFGNKPVLEVKKPRPGRDILATIQFRFAPPLLNDIVLDQILRASYITGSAQTYSLRYLARVKTKDGRYVRRWKHDKDAAGFMRLAQPEYSRPMLARFAAAVGRRELLAVRKLLKSK